MPPINDSLSLEIIVQFRNLCAIKNKEFSIPCETSGC